MTITRADVADLRPGDVVELTWTDNPDSKVIGKVWQDQDGCLRHGMTVIRRRDGDPWMGARRELTVVSRAPRPLYVNHDRTEPVQDDVVKSADGGQLMWVCRKTLAGTHRWMRTVDMAHQPHEELPARLRLLVDGETGQVVP